MTEEKIKFYCTRCKRFIDNPKASRMTVVGVTGQMECDECGGNIAEITERREDKIDKKVMENGD